MARKTAQTTAVVNWDEEMARDAEIAAGTQRQTGGGGKFVSTRSGILSLDKEPLPGNQMAVVVLADTMMNAYYDGPFDPENAQSPKCFAFGSIEADMEPHEAVDNDAYFERQNEVCRGCPNNEWASAATGKGKACKNMVRLALIPAGDYVASGSGRNKTFELETYADPDDFSKSEVAYLNVSVTSVALWAAYVKGLAAETRRPPWGMITNIWIEPHPKFQYQLKFEAVAPLERDVLAVVQPRAKQSAIDVAFPYSPPKKDDEEAATPARAATANKVSRGRAAAPRKR